MLGYIKEKILLVRAINTNLYKNNYVANSLNFGATGQKKSAQTNPYGEKYDQERATQDIRKALDVLGDKKLELILHNASAPSKAAKDVGIGSLYSESSRELLIPFLEKYGFSGIQVDPEGMRPEHDASPYVSNSFVYNPLIIDLEDLTRPENGAIVDKNVYKSIVRLNPARNSEYGDYKHARDSFDLGLTNAWKNFKAKSANLDSISDPVEKDAVAALANEYADYSRENGQMLEPYAIYSILSERFNNDYYKNWPQEFQNLYNPRNDALINSIKAEHQDDIDKFIFVDMLAKNARENGIETFEDAGIKTEGDNPVAFSNQEVWAHPGAFLKDYKMGCPPDNDNPDGQAWGFAVLNPAKLFNHDGSLGESGQLLYDKCEKLAQDNQGGIRIDHIVGLIDPYVYKNSPVDGTAGRLFSSPHNPDLRQFAIPVNNHDSAKKFGAILEKIVLPACVDAGLTKDDIICENLGAIPDHARAAFERLGLGGMIVTQYHNGMSARPTDTIMLGSHDTLPFVSYVDNLYGRHGQDPFNHALWPAVENSLPRTATHDEKQAEFDKYRFDMNRHQPEVNKAAFKQKKFTELFTSPAQRVQIFWTDLLGMEQRYNTPGTSTSKNWSLRLSSDFEKQFDPSMLIQALSDALKAQDEKTVKANQDLINSLDANAQAAREQKQKGLNLIG